jgi:hypothetical protein
MILLEKGVLIMTTGPVADGARILGIHPKTLHHWLGEAHMTFAAHPTDSRIKCVTLEQIQQLARLHGRPLRPPSTTHPLLSQEQTPPTPDNGAECLQTAHALPISYPLEAALLQKLSCLETRVLTLQEQIAQLALTLLREREQSVEGRLTALETVIQEVVGRPICPLPLPDRGLLLQELEQSAAPKRTRPLHPAEQRARSRRPPLIEYSAQGTYVIVRAQEGEVHLDPESRAWFDWLATLSSFRFVGKQGRFTAHRGYNRGQQTRFWSASRCIRSHSYKHYLGVTESLTIASLEHVAARLQSDVDAL